MMEIQIAKRRRMSFKQAPPMQLTPLQAAQVQLAKRRRMSFKQAPPMQPTPLQSAQVGLPNYTAEEDDKARRRVYLVTFPHPRNALSATGIPLVAPESMSKRALLEKLLAACAQPDYADARSQHRNSFVDVLRTGVFFELHKEDEAGAAHKHGHSPLYACEKFGYLPVKRALLRRFGLASHWSCTHDGYWSAVRYLFVPSPQKPAGALDRAPVLWGKLGPHPQLQDCCHEPLTAAATAARRLAQEHKAAEEGQREPRATELDVWPLVVKNGFKNTPNCRNAHLELIEFAKRCCSYATQAFLFKIRSRLPELIDDIWQWETVEETLLLGRRSRVESMRAAWATACVCSGLYGTAVVESLHANSIDVRQVCVDIMASLHLGRCEKVPVLVFAGSRGGEGKSLFLKSLFTVFGYEYVFSKPEVSSFPLLDLPGKSVAFLDDWRFDDSVLSYSSQCLWYDGSPLQIARPQNQTGVKGHLLYRGTAPIFATTKLQDIKALRFAAADDPQTGCPRDAETSMVLRRLKIYEFNARIAKPIGNLPYCGHCFADLVLRQSGAV
jgi:hypothetical protein